MRYGKERERGGNNRYQLRPQMQLHSTSGTIPRRETNSKSKENKWRSWADFPQELLSIISNYLTIADFLTFGRVCKSWRKVVQETKEDFMASQSPLVIYISPKAKRCCHFYDIFTGTNYKTELPYFACKSFRGISSGYLVLQDYASNICLINPVTGHQIKFPEMPKTFINHRTETFMSDFLVSCAVVVGAMGSCNSDNVVVVVLSRVMKNLHFCTSSDQEWRCYSFEDKPWMIIDIVIFKGLISVLTSDSQIGLFSLSSCDMMVQKESGAPRVGINARLVPSGDRLLVVDFVPLEWVKIYSVDLETRRWVELRDLGNETLFIGATMSSKSSKTIKWGGRTNCIYHFPLMLNYCFVHSLNGEVLEILPTFERRDGFPKLKCWYFLLESQSKDIVNEF